MFNITGFLWNILIIRSGLSTEAIILYSAVTLLIIFVLDLLDWNYYFCKYVTPRPNHYGYSLSNGPSKWKNSYPNACGSRQSPINISCNSAIVTPVRPLKWSSEFSSIPSEMYMVNDGHGVQLFTSFYAKRPTLSGGNLKPAYELYNIRFRWGPNDDEGSEHTIDYTRYALELQGFFTNIKCCGMSVNENSFCFNKDTVAVVTYLFKITPSDNPFLEPIISKLREIRHPGCKCCLNPFPLIWLMPPFATDYYVYSGSLTFPPCTEGVKCIIQPEPIAISSKQVKKFRKCMSTRGLIKSNVRPIQKLHSREVFYFTNCEE